jgi:hypothetical protein
MPFFLPAKGSSEYLNDILEHLQSHMNKCSMDISSQQNKLLLRCKSLDDTATMVTKKMTVSLNHAMVTAEKVGQGNSHLIYVSQTV